MAKFNKVKSDAFQGIQKGAGNLLKTFDVTGETEIADADIICATTGGVKADCVPSYVDYGDDIDNCPPNTMELKEIESWEAKLGFTALDMTKDSIKLALGAADISGNKIVARKELKTSDFQSIWWVGPLKGGGWAAVKLLNALSTSGFSFQSTDDGKGNLSVELTGHYSMSNTDTVPMEFYIAPATTTSTGSTS